MALVSNGIEKVRVFELLRGIQADGGGVGAQRLALVKWRSSWSDKLYQVYVNGRYAGVTLRAEQRQIVVPVPTSLERPIRIEVFAVEDEQADVDFSDELDSSDGHEGRVRISFLRSQELPIGATIQIYCNGGSGEVDYDNPVNDSPIRVWSTWQDKGGFGMSRFGVGDFGFDAAAAVGFGRGCFGNVQFGFDVDSIEWITEPMSAGVYKFGVKVVDEAGNESSAVETREVTVSPLAMPAEQMSVFSFDKQINQLVLSVS